MLRYEAIETIYPDLRDHIVVTIMGAVAAELYTAGHRPNFFYLEHAMGLASSDLKLSRLFILTCETTSSSPSWARWPPNSTLPGIAQTFSISNTRWASHPRWG